VVARRAWELVSQVIGVQTGSDFESIAKMWLCNKIFGVINIVTSAVCWGIWKLRNLICFQRDAWLGMQMLWKQVLPMLRSWEDSGPPEASSWLRQCNQLAGENHLEAGANHAEPPGGFKCGA
jgi:hypothetical protein